MPEETNKKSIKKYYDNVNIGKRTRQIVYTAHDKDKAAMVALFLANSDKKQSVIITKSKRRADELSLYLKSKGISATPIHSNHRAAQVEEAREAFNSRVLHTIITTNMTLHALALGGIETILNYDLSSDYEEYFSRLVLVDEVGESILFVSPEEKTALSIIEIKLKNEIPQEELKGFMQADEELSIHSSKEKTKKPRHQKKKTKKTAKKEEQF